MEKLSQQYTVSFKDFPWSSRQDIYDYYDLRYLFDNDEILESKRQLIEDSDKYFWCTYDDEEEEEHDEIFAMNNANMDVEEENWDEDDDSEIVFIYGIGLYHDGYDSGIDEPYGRREAFPSRYDDTEF